MLRPYCPHERDSMSTTNPPLPARLLHRILVGGNHNIGEHVLIAGDHCGETAEWLDELGFDVEAIDDSNERLSARQRCGARFEIRLAKLDLTDNLGDVPFDLILADELSLHRDNLLSLRARLATAELLSHLKPQGELVIVREPRSQVRHDVACWTRHLACFPGRLETFAYPTPLFSREMFRWIVHGNRPEPFLTVSLKVPSERLTQVEWCHHAQCGLLTSQSCCGDTNVASMRRAG